MQILDHVNDSSWNGKVQNFPLRCDQFKNHIEHSLKVRKMCLLEFFIVLGKEQITYFGLFDIDFSQSFLKLLVHMKLCNVTVLVYKAWI